MTTLGDLFKSFAKGQWIYLQHAVGLFLPGHPPDTYKAHQVDAGTLDGWSEQDLDLLIEEGRRQLDQQYSDLERIRNRAQFVFLTSLALVGTLGGLIRDTSSTGGWASGLWLASALATTWALLGAAGIMTVTAVFSGIDSAVLSNYPPPIKPRLAADYAGMLADGENTVATRLTVHRSAVLWLLVGAYFALAAWIQTQ